MAEETITYYVTLDDLYSRLSQEVLVQLTDDAKTGAIVTDRVDEAIEFAQSEIDAALRTQYSLPLVEPFPPILKQIGIDIVVYRLYLRRRRVAESDRQA